MSKSRSVYDAFVRTPWAILPETLSVLSEIVTRHMNGEKLTPEEIEARVHGAARPPERRINKVAVLPVFGAIFPRANLMTDVSGATSLEQTMAKFDAFVDDPSIDAVVLDINSPGGQAGGVAEAADKIYQARSKKRIVAVANHMAASAAYWIGTAADEFVASPSSVVGSIGVFSEHDDWSKSLEMNGIKVTLISAGKYKVAGNPYEPLDEISREVIQKRVDDVYDQFVAAVARHRNVKESAVRNGFGEGALVGAEEAVKLGMADRVARLDEVINGLFGVNEGGGARADGDFTLNPNPSPIKGEGSQAEKTSTGQEPEADKPNLQKARARLAQVSNLSITGDSNMLRELLKQREDMLARAQSLYDTADKENREMTEAEQKEFDEIMGAGDQPGKLAALDTRIEKLQGDREKLRTAAEKKFGTNAESSKKAEKPEGNNTNTMKRVDFEKLSQEKQGQFIRQGGRLVD